MLFTSPHLASSTGIKICGLNTVEAAHHAERQGADFLGFVFYERSPRHISTQQAQIIRQSLSHHAQYVAVTVDSTDQELETIMRTLEPDWIQLHGRESPERCLQVKALTGKPVIRALGISRVEDLKNVSLYQKACDRLLFDAKPPAKDTHLLPGGNGISFDWKLLTDLEMPVPWFLSGGLNAANIQEALQACHAPYVDVSSGVEEHPGVKSLTRISDFIYTVRNFHDRNPATSDL
jgi:phosphoribosylanthranilate isomerase